VYSLGHVEVNLWAEDPGVAHLLLEYPLEEDLEEEDLLKKGLSELNLVEEHHEAANHDVLVKNLFLHLRLMDHGLMTHYVKYFCPGHNRTVQHLTIGHNEVHHKHPENMNQMDNPLDNHNYDHYSHLLQDHNYHNRINRYYQSYSHEQLELVQASMQVEHDNLVAHHNQDLHKVDNNHRIHVYDHVLLIHCLRNEVGRKDHANLCNRIQRDRKDKGLDN
jgi:hypothetical protein